MILFYLLLSFSLISFSKEPSGKLFFYEKEYDFGRINSQKDTLLVKCFSFINNTAKPIVVQKARTSCYCTSVEWSREPIMPGKSGIVKVKFHSTKWRGYFDKSIYIKSNVDANIIRIHGKVI